MKTRLLPLIIFCLFTTYSYSQHGWSIFNTSTNSKIVGNDRIYSIVIDSANYVWAINTGTNIIHIFKDSTVSSLENYQISVGQSGSFIIDRKGNKWVFGGGISKWNGTYWRNYNPCNSNLPDGVWVNWMVADSLNNIWIATRNDGLLMFNDTTFTIYNYANSILPYDKYYSLAIDKKGNLWLGTANYGLYKNEKGKWTNYNTSNSGIPANNIYSMAVDSAGNIWCGTGTGGIGVFDGNKWTVYNTSNSGVADNYVRYFSFIDSTVWIATGTAGICRFDGKHWTTYNTNNSPLPCDYVNSLAYDKSKNRLWAGTMGGGVVSFDLDSVKIPIDTIPVDTLPLKTPYVQNIYENFDSVGVWSTVNNSTYSVDSGHMNCVMAFNSTKYRGDLWFNNANNANNNLFLKPSKDSILAIKFIGKRPDGSLKMEFNTGSVWFNTKWNGGSADGALTTTGGNSIYYFILHKDTNYVGDSINVRRLHFTIADTIVEPYSYKVDWVASFSSMNDLKAFSDYKDDGINDSDEIVVDTIPIDTTTTDSTKTVSSIAINKSIPSIKIYPNPSTGVIHISNLESGFEPNLINIYDITGKLVFSEKLDPSKQEVSFPFITSGLYMVELKSNRKRYITNMTFKK